MTLSPGGELCSLLLTDSAIPTHIPSLLGGLEGIEEHPTLFNLLNNYTSAYYNF